MVQLTKHFASEEFDCRDGCGYGRIHSDLVEMLEDLRGSIGGKPLTVVSGLRCPPRNAAVGGSARSSHCAGLAADIEAGLVTERQARRIGFTGIGLKGKWVTHVDIRRAQRAVVWEY